MAFGYTLDSYYRCRCLCLFVVIFCFFDEASSLRLDANVASASGSKRVNLPTSSEQTISFQSKDHHRVDTLKVLHLSYNSESQGPLALRWFPDFMTSEKAKEAQVIVACQQEALNDRRYHEFPMSFDSYLMNVEARADLKDELLQSWTLLAPAYPPVGRKAREGLVSEKPPNHIEGRGYFCGQETRADFRGSCQFMTIWIRRGLTNLEFAAETPRRVFPEDALQAHINASADDSEPGFADDSWNDMWRNKAVLGTRLFANGQPVANMMCAHLPPTNGRSKPMEWFQSGGRSNLSIASIVTGDLNFRPPSAILPTLSMKGKLDFERADQIANEYLANKDNLLHNLINFETMSMHGPLSDSAIRCSSPASASTGPTYARWYESPTGRLACMCYDKGVSAAKLGYASAVREILDEDACRTSIVDELLARNGHISNPEQIGEHCEREDVSLDALIMPSRLGCVGHCG